MSAVIALREESPTLSETSDDPAVLKEELRNLTTTLNVVERLQNYARLQQQSQEHMANAKFVMLTLDIPNRQLTIRGYRRQDDAATAYAELEAQSGDGVDSFWCR